MMRIGIDSPGAGKHYEPSELERADRLKTA